MSGRKLHELPPELARARDRFQDWRRKRRPKTRIPEPLWKLAVRLASAQGIWRTAAALGLDYYSLKKRLAVANGPQVVTASAAPAFVELPAPRASEKQCVLELDDGAGATLRVQLAGYDAADVVALSCRLWNAE